MAKAKKKKKPSGDTVAVNRKARFNYEISDTIEAGLVLTGNEIKSIREGGITIAEAYVKPTDNELFLIGAHIKEYSHSAARDYNPLRSRKLLVHRKQIEMLRGKVEAKGFTIVPLRIYLKNGRAKLEIGIAKGKAAPDKRKTVIEREQKRDAERYIKNSK